MMADNLNVPMHVSMSPVHMRMIESQLCDGFHTPVNDNCGRIKTNFLKPEIHVEILQQNTSTFSSENVVQLAHEALKNVSSLVEDVVLHEFEDPEVKQHIKSISLNIPSPDCDQSICIEESKLIYHTFRLNTDTEDTESIESEGVSAATYWILPAEEFHGSWENLIYDTDIKSYLLNFVSKSLLFAEKKVDANIITWNKVVLLHGPPGTGKTSLCRALAQKLCIRLSEKYKYGQLIEINSHSLFSKWFSESGKLVMKMFMKIHEIIDDPEALVFVLIDEVESLAHSRQASLGGAEPSDSLRVVNALLTQLDKIKTYPNVVILTTSNITEAIDTALIDRADIRHYIGLPSVPAIYQIYSSCIRELQRTKLIYTKEAILPRRMFNTCSSEMLQCSFKLTKIAEQSEGLSGRTLGKLPFLAFALYIKTTATLDDFLDALSKAVNRQFQETSDMKVNK